MTLFKKAEMQTAYLKMNIYGEAGSGKTYTGSQIAIGLAGHIKKSKMVLPTVMFLDTEAGASWVKPIFDKAGIELLVATTRSFKDLKQAVTEAEDAGAILLADSITHLWQELMESFLQAKRKRLNKPSARLELPDWNVIKAEWGKFTSQYLNSKCHIILCGRAGQVYEFQENEETHKKEMISSGTRMAAEKGLGYEANLLVEMTSHQVVGAKKAKVIVRRATILKDRSTILDGKQFENPKFENFLPHIKKLNLGGEHAGFDDTRTSSALFPKEERDDTRHDRDILLEDLQALLDAHGLGGTSNEAKTGRAEMMKRFFKTVSKTEIEKKIPLHDLRHAFNALHIELEGVPSRYFPSEPEDIDDEIPHMNGAAPDEKPAHMPAELMP